MRGYLVGYSWSLLMTTWLTARAFDAGRFDAIQTCNPPDIFWTLGAAFRVLAGTRFVYDQHDLCPELYESRFATAGRVGACARCSGGTLQLPRRGPRHRDEPVIPAGGAEPRP